MGNRGPDWLRQAEADLEHAQSALDNEDYEWSCFASQQAAEKGLEGLFYFLHGDPWGHSFHQTMRNLFFPSARPKFVNRDQILELARTMAKQMAEKHPEISRVLLFGSFARGDFNTRSDIDLLVILKSTSLPLRERIAKYLGDCTAYPTDVFPLTNDEIQQRLEERDPFWTRAIGEAIELR